MNLKKSYPVNSVSEDPYSSRSIDDLINQVDKLLDETNLQLHPPAEPKRLEDIEAFRLGDPPGEQGYNLTSFNYSLAPEIGRV